jgi:hypothetical protein
VRRASIRLGRTGWRIQVPPRGSRRPYALRSTEGVLVGRLELSASWLGTDSRRPSIPAIPPTSNSPGQARSHSSSSSESGALPSLLPGPATGRIRPLRVRTPQLPPVPGPALPPQPTAAPGCLVTGCLSRAPPGSGRSPPPPPSRCHTPGPGSVPPGASRGRRRPPL